MSEKEERESSTDCRDDKGIAVQMIDSIIGMVRVLKNNYSDLVESGPVREALMDLAQDEDLAWVLELATKADLDLEVKDLEEDEEELENDAQSGTTQPTYIDESGKVFTATDIVSGYRPKGEYKGYSISERVSSEEFGKTK